MSPITILIADDHDVVRDGLRLILESEEDFDVVGEAANGAEAVKCFEERKYDLSFIDFRMPRMNGADCFFAIRARHPDAKIVLMTGFKEPAVDKALQAGALALLQKPFRMEEITKIARQFG